MTAVDWLNFIGMAGTIFLSLSIITVGTCLILSWLCDLVDSLAPVGVAIVLLIVSFAFATYLWHDLPPDQPAAEVTEEEVFDG